MKQFCKDKSLNLIEELSHIQNKVKESVDNYFFICLSYTEIKFDMTFKIKQKGLAAIDIELNYFVKDKSNKTTSRVFDGQL